MSYSDFQSTSTFPSNPSDCDWTGSGSIGSGPVLLAICTDINRSGCAIYDDCGIKLIADRRDPGDPYKGLDLIIQRTNPQVVIVSSVQTRLIDFLEKRFRFKVLDLSRRDRSKRFKSSRSQATMSHDIGSVIPVIQDLRSQTSDSAAPFASYLNRSNSNGQNNSHLTQPSGINQHVQVIGDEMEEISDARDYAFTLAIVPNVWFAMSNGLKKLSNSEFVKSKGFSSQEDKTIYIASKVQTHLDVCAIRSISALDKYIINVFINGQCSDSTQATRSLHGLTQNTVQQLAQSQQTTTNTNLTDNLTPSNLMPIMSVGYVDPGPVLSMDRFTFESLSIFSSKTFFKKSEEKEVDPDAPTLPCLFELLDQCSSPQGKRRLRTMMLWPLQDLTELNGRLDAIEYLMQPDNKLLRDQFATYLKNVFPLGPILAKLNMCVGSYKEMTAVYKTLWSFISIIDIIKTCDNPSLMIFERIVALDSQDLRSSTDAIVSMIDFDASRRDNRIQVLEGVDQKVDQKKEVAKNLTTMCDDVAVQETAKYRSSLGKIFNVMYVPRIGFLASIQYSSTTELIQISQNREFEVLLFTEQSVYFKTPRMEELDRNAGDVACDLIDVQESVVVNLQEDILKQSECILKLMELCGELDCLLAFSMISIQRGYTRPEFVSSEEEIDIKDAYHPLLYAKCQTIPNGIRFYKDASSRKAKLMLITGPNACGKTTYMKTTCLVIYMAHIGCFVPALSAKIPIMDAILTRIHSAGSISTGLSTFATDLRQISYALNRGTHRSIIAIDEFGKGTHTPDGFALLKALIIYYATLGSNSPYVMITTHFNRLVDHLHTYSEYIIYKTFKFHRDQQQDNIVYEFKQVDGIGDSSLADHVAAKAGIPKRIIERAKEVRACLVEGRQIKPLPPRGA